MTERLPVAGAGRRSGALLIAGALLAGCASSEHQGTTEPEPPRTGPCYIADTLHPAAAEAERCWEAYQHGRVAVIDYGDNLPADQQAADTAAGIIRTASDGVVNLTFTVVPASDTAKAQLASAEASAPCIAPANVLEAAHIADNTMPELAQSFQWTMALDPGKPCQPIAGQANENTFRDAVVFLSDLPDVPLLVPPPEDQPKPDTKFTIRADDMAHEELHLLRMGHDGDISTPNISPLPLFAAATAPPTDLATVLDTYKYNEYCAASSDPMGNLGGATPQDASLAPSQKAQLEWPMSVLGLPSRPNVQWLTAGESYTFGSTYAVDPGGSLIMVPLSPSYKFPMSSSLPDKPSSISFDRLIIVANLSLPDPQLPRATVYLADSAGDTVEISSIFEGSSRMRARYRGLVISIYATSTAVTAAVASSTS